MYYDPESKEFYEDGEGPASPQKHEPLFSARVAGHGRFWMHLTIGLAATGYAGMLLPDGLALAGPVLYWSAVYYFKPTVQWFQKRRALKRYRRDLYSQDPLAELEKMR
jgi:hypothetical protein